MSKYILDYQRLMRARLLIKRSKTDMARVLKVTYVTYNGWEKGRVTPNPKFRGILEKVMKLAEERAGVTKGVPPGVAHA